MKPENKKTLDYIADVFTGADGGIMFIKFRKFIERLEDSEDKDDLNSEKIIEIMNRFRAMIEISQVV